MAKKCKKLEEIKAMFKDVEIDLDQIETNELQNFMIIFKEQNDTRIQGKVKHLMSDIIMISFLAILARCDGWDEIAMFAVSKEEWLNKFLELPNGIPSHDTMQRVISLLNPETLYIITADNITITKILINPIFLYLRKFSFINSPFPLLTFPLYNYHFIHSLRINYV